MKRIVISGTGLYTPAEAISNLELVDSFNLYVASYNRQHASRIEQGELAPLLESSCEFIEKASGIKSRYVVDKAGILDPEIMRPRLAERDDNDPSLQCEMGVAAARQALQAAGKEPCEVDAVLVACSNLQRPYPAVAIEIQNQLGIEGFGVDMNMACSSATFAMQTACDAIAQGNARSVLVINPEICSGHLNFRDRDCHFIFGDACTALLLESAESCRAPAPFEILSTRLKTTFSNNIRNNFGFLNRTHPETANALDKLFVQQGRKVFKEVIPMVSTMILDHLAASNIDPAQLKRLWLHQANLGMNSLISKKVLGRDATSLDAPVILDRYANTSSAGSIIAFHLHRDDLETGALGVICSFGAGYSVGSVIVRRVA
jgi:beta-ketodecanoyl-[acyl-carrier-protein] synthase